MSRLHPEAISEGLFVSNHTLQVSPAVRSSVLTANSGWEGQGPSSSVHGTGVAPRPLFFMKHHWVKHQVNLLGVCTYIWLELL